MTFYNVQRYEIRHRLHGLIQIIYLRHNLKLRSGEMPGKILPYVLHRIVLYGLVRMGYDANAISGYLWYVEEEIIEKV